MAEKDFGLVDGYIYHAGKFYRAVPYIFSNNKFTIMNTCVCMEGAVYKDLSGKVPDEPVQPSTPPTGVVYPPEFYTTKTFLFPIRPIDNGWLSQPFKSSHKGIDIIHAKDNYIYASADGTVSMAFDGCENLQNIIGYGVKGYGNVIIINHGTIGGTHYSTLYGHLLKGTVWVKAGDKVKKGQLIAKMGNSGDSFGRHLHFEMMTKPYDASHSANFNPLNILTVDNK